MRMMTIASGSSGNCVYIGSDNTHILIDAGISKKKIVDGLKEADLSLSDIDAIFVTHEHSDHIKGLGFFQEPVRYQYIRRVVQLRALRQLQVLERLMNLC